MSAAVESMTKLELCGLRIRIWRTEATIEDAVSAANTDLNMWRDQTAGRVVTDGEFQLSMLQIFRELRAFERVAAIEVVDSDGVGAVDYVTW
jgi:hypothetical protein